MKSMKKIVANILVMFIMIAQMCSVTMAKPADLSNLQLPDQMAIPGVVKNAQSYKEIPVYYEQGNNNSTTPVEAVTVYLKKTGGTHEAEGYATFKVKGYAYRNNTDITLGIVYGYYRPDGTWTEEFLDQAGIENLEGVYPGSEWKNDATWDEWKTREYWTRVTDFTLTPDQENNEGTRVRYKTNTNLNNGEFRERDSQDVLLTAIPFAQPLKVTRTVEEVPWEMNVWQVNVKVENQGAIQVDAPTDVVLLLDRSGSMMEGATFICGKEQHQHGEQCYKKTYEVTPEGRLELVKKLTCTREEHVHDKSCYQGEPRCQRVEEASQTLISELVKNTNTRIAVVSFGGGEILDANKKYEHFDDNWNSVMEDKSFDMGWYSNYTVDCPFTNDRTQLFNGVSQAMSNIGGGTPIATGLIKAGKMLKESTAKNRVVVLLSDGGPSYRRDGSGTGSRNDAALNMSIDKDLADAALEVQQKVPGVKMFSIATGKNIDEKERAALRSCASSPEYYYNSEDTLSALEKVIKDILEEVKQVTEGALLEESLADQFALVLPKDQLNGDSIQVRPESEMDSVNWDTTNAVITQGSLTLDNTGKIGWNIGNIEEKQTAVMSYRVRMTSGLLKEKYKLYKDTTIRYRDRNNQQQQRPLTNEDLQASWAITNVGSYDEVGNLLGDGQKKVCFKIDKENYKDGDVFISRQTQVIGDKAVASGGTKLEDLFPVPAGYQLADIRFRGEPGVLEPALAPTKKVTIVEVMSDIANIMIRPIISEVEDSKHNYIQPEGVTNVAAKIDLKAPQSRALVYEVDLKPLVEDTLGGKTVINYEIDLADKIATEVRDEEGKLYRRGSDYTVKIEDQKVKIMTSDSLILGQDATLIMSVYFRGTLAPDIAYTKQQGSYVDSLVKSEVKVKVPVTVSVESKLIDDTTDETGNTVQHWGESPLSVSRDIEVRYVEIAQIN